MAINSRSSILRGEGSGESLKILSYPFPCPIPHNIHLSDASDRQVFIFFSSVMNCLQSVELGWVLESPKVQRLSYFNVLSW